MDKNFTSYRVDDRSYVAFVKREIHNELLHSHFGKSRIAETDIVIAELTSNLIKHAGGGELLSRITDIGKDASILELVTIDNGPGIGDISKMMKDGVSTTNTLGQGLGAIKRLSNLFQIFSLPKWGTVSYSLLRSAAEPSTSQGFDAKALIVPKPGESVSGDGVQVLKTKEEVRIFFGDGLGHGEHAHEAVTQATEFFQNCTETDPVEIIRAMHDAVRKTRGLVAAIAILDIVKRKWRFCGVGNIVTRLHGGITFKHYLSYNGIVGLNIPKSLNVSEMPAERNQLLIMSSDGLKTGWDFNKYPNISKSDPMLLASALYKDFSRRNDDATIFIGKQFFAS